MMAETADSSRTSASPRLITRANEVRAVKNQFHMQAIVDQQNGFGGLGVAPVAAEFGRIGQRQVIHQQRAALHVIAARVGVAGACDGKSLIQEHPRAGDDACAPALVIGAFGRKRSHGIRAIKPVIKAAPTGIGGVQRIAGIGDGHHQLRAWHMGDFRVGIGGFDFEIIALGQEIADFDRKAL